MYPDYAPGTYSVILLKIDARTASVHACAILAVTVCAGGPACQTLVSIT